jgi:glycosidase
MPRLSLDGEWLFNVDSTRAGVRERWFDETTDRSSWVKVETPDFWEWYPGMAGYDGWGWFARTFNLPLVSEPHSIHFAGVDDDAVVWINGVRVGDHGGYSDPFALDITEALRPGENLVVVQVLDYGGGGGIYRPITIIESRLLDELLKSEFYGTPARPSPDWVRDAVVYEVYLRSFSPEGTFAGLKNRLQELKDFGITVIWLMPIHPVGKVKRKGSLGSPYAVQDYYGVNPEFGTLDEFRSLVEAVHGHGMKIIIDLVINHTSWDSRLLKEHPGWFSKDASGNVVAPNTDWTDVADLDFAHTGLRGYLMDMMEYWVREIGIDGYRCDVAELIPIEFWEQARERLDRIKPVMMLSEGSLPEHHRKAFDITYSWNVYDALQPILMEKRPVELLDQLMKVESLQFPAGSLRLRFATNHDKNAWDAPAVEKFGEDGLKVAAVLVNTLPGVPLMYNGEEVANDTRLDLFEKVTIDWSRPRWLGDLAGRLFHLRQESDALTRGKMIRIETPDVDGVYSFLRAGDSDAVLVLLNFSTATRRFSVSLPAGEIPGGDDAMTLRDVFLNQRLTIGRPAGGPLECELGPRDFRVYLIED